MKRFNIAAIFIYTLIFCIVGAILVALSLRKESLEMVINMLVYLSQTDNLRMGMALAGLFLILINISIAQLTLGKLQKQKTIAFENPFGQVTLSLSAIEDYIKKLTHRMPEIREIKSAISAGKSGIEVASKVVLYSDVNIPDVTEKIQNMIKIKLQEILGIEETVTIKIHVTKIIPREKNNGHKETMAKAEPGGGFKGEIQF